MSKINLKEKISNKGAERTYSHRTLPKELLKDTLQEEGKMLLGNESKMQWGMMSKEHMYSKESLKD